MFQFFAVTGFKQLANYPHLSWQAVLSPTIDC